MDSDNAFFQLLRSVQNRDSGLAFELKVFKVFAFVVAAFWAIGVFCFLASDGFHRIAQLGEYMGGVYHFFVWPFLVGALVGGPLRQLVKDASVHTTLFHGRCYGDVLTSQLKSSEIVDGVARHSLFTIARQQLPAVALGGALLALGYPAYSLTVVKVVCIWTPLMLLLTWSSSYLAQQLSISNGLLKSSALGSLVDSLMGLATGLPAGIAMVGCWISWMVTGQMVVPGLFLLLYIAVTAGLSRRLAILGLDRLPLAWQKAEQAGKKLVPRRRNPFVRNFVDNPVVARETARDAARLPFGLLGWLLGRHWPVCLLGWLLFYFGLPNHHGEGEGFFWLGVLTVAGLEWYLASRRTLNAVVDEVEKGTLDSLLTTCLKVEEYVDGWWMVGALPRMLQSLVLLAMLWPLGLKGEVNFVMMALAALLLLGLPAMGSMLGLYASLAANRKECLQRFSNTSMVLGFGTWILWVALVGILEISLTPAANLGLMVGLSVGVTLVLRRLILGQLRV